MILWKILGRQFRHPHGFSGRCLGYAMRFLNAKPNSLAIDSLQIREGDTILELGSGPGEAISYILKSTQAKKIWGLELSVEMIRQANNRNKAAIETKRLELIQADFHAIPLPDNSVDKILAVNVVYFWDNTSKVAAECRRILRTGGLISVYATTSNTMQKWKFASPSTHRQFSSESLKVPFLETGFTQIHIQSVHFGPFAKIDGVILTARKA